MRILTQALKRWLARNGILAVKVVPELPPSAADWLRDIAGTADGSGRVVCLDDDLQIQAEILDAFPHERVTLASPGTVSSPPPDQGIPSAAAGTNAFLLEIDGARCDFHADGRPRPEYQAEIVLVRYALGRFWSGSDDLNRTTRRFRTEGYELFDVIEYGRPQFLRGALGRVVLVFCLPSILRRLAPRFPHRSQRLADALGCLNAPIISAASLRTLAGRDTPGFNGGVFNPGAVRHDSGLLLVARGERDCSHRHVERLCPPEPAGTSARFFAGTCPLLMTVDQDLSVQRLRPMTWRALPANQTTRMEDCRLFRFRGELFSNHSVVTPERDPTPARDRLTAVRHRVGVSALDPDRSELTFLGTAGLDGPLAAHEKNWAMFEQRDALFALYSFQPYRLLRADQWPSLTFSTVQQRRLKLPFASGQDSFVRNSINPIEYDPDHLLHVVHEVRPVQHYIFWAVLIEKSSLLPVCISARPLARSGEGAVATMVYISSAVADASDVVFFGGLDDSTTAAWRVGRDVLNSEWIPLI